RPQVLQRPRGPHGLRPQPPPRQGAAPVRQRAGTRLLRHGRRGLSPGRRSIRPGGMTPFGPIESQRVCIVCDRGRHILGGQRPLLAARFVMSTVDATPSSPANGPVFAGTAPETGTARVKRGMAEMLKGGVIMDVVTPEQAKIAEDAGAVAVMALERVP